MYTHMTVIDESYASYGDDWTFCTRVLVKDNKIVCVMQYCSDLIVTFPNGTKFYCDNLKQAFKHIRNYLGE